MNKMSCISPPWQLKTLFPFIPRDKLATVRNSVNVVGTAMTYEK